jgi:hypothetical protein
MSKVFLSYAASDTPFAEALVRKLGTSGVSGWRDASDVSSGSAISAKIREALQTSSAVVVLLSPEALLSHGVQFEVGAAEALNKRIIPVVVGGENIQDSAPDILKQRQWVDARDRSPDEIADEIKRVLQ